jgi:hypothetical protein
MIRFTATAALAGGLAFAASALAADPEGHGGMGHGGMGGARMPQHGFHGAPPNAPHPAPHGGAKTGAPRFQEGRPGHDLGVFNGHRYSQFTAHEREQWQHGGWRHEEHHGHHGWWWVVGDLWFFYPQPIFPYPTYVGPDYYYDYYDNYPEPSYYWYYCEDPAGYYPYIQQCNVEWQAVPPTP